jgi:hypothetical protein
MPAYMKKRMNVAAFPPGLCPVLSWLVPAATCKIQFLFTILHVDKILLPGLKTFCRNQNYASAGYPMVLLLKPFGCINKLNQ